MDWSIKWYQNGAAGCCCLQVSVGYFMARSAHKYRRYKNWIFQYSSGKFRNTEIIVYGTRKRWRQTTHESMHCSTNHYSEESPNAWRKNREANWGMRWGITDSIVTRLRAGRPGFYSRQGQDSSRHCVQRGCVADTAGAFSLGYETIGAW